MTSAGMQSWNFNQDAVDAKNWYQMHGILSQNLSNVIWNKQDLK